MFKKLLESLDFIAHSAPAKRRANESKYPWLDHKDRPGNKKSEFSDEELAKQAREEKIKLKDGEGDPKKKKVAEAAKEKGNYYVEKEDGEWHVFHTEKTKAFGSYSEKSEADAKAKSLNEAVTLSADGDEAMELINGMRKLAGMSPVAGSLSPVPAPAAAPVAAAPAPEAPPAPVAPEPAPPVSNAEQTTAAFASLPADSWDDADDEEETDDDEQMVVGGDADDDDDEEDDVKEADNASIYANSPDESTQDASAVTGNGDDMHKKKSGYPAAASGDNPMKAFEGKFKAIMADLLKD